MALVSAAVQDERRDADRGEHVAHVEVVVHQALEPRRARAHRQPLEVADPLQQPRVARQRGRERLGHQRAVAPVLLHGSHAFAPLAPRRRPVVALGGGRAGEARVEHERSDSLRMRGGEQHRHRPALQQTEHRRPLRSGGVEHCDHVVHLLLERRRAPEPVREAGLAAVEQDQPREGGHALEEAPHQRLGEQVLELREGLRDVEEVERPVAEHPVGQAHVPVARVPGLPRHRARDYSGVT